MDQFEQARLKYEKNRTQQGRPLPKTLADVSSTEDTLPPVPPAQIPSLLVPKVKARAPSASCVLKVTVILPDGEFGFELVKESIYQNANRGRMNVAEFRKHVQEGLKPLLGETR